MTDTPSDPRTHSGNPTDDDLVAFLLEETGETLYIVVEYDRDGPEFRYVSDVVSERMRDWEDRIDEILEQFRSESIRTSEWKELFDVGEFYCSLHLFDDLLVIHFNGDGSGIIFGYDPEAASNLTAFVELCLPIIRRHAVDDVPSSPNWHR